MELTTSIEAMDSYLEAMARTKVVDREARESYWTITQSMYDLLYQEELLPYQIHCTGSRFDGTPREVCGDEDFMFSSPSYPTVLIDDSDFVSTSNITQSRVGATVNLRHPAYVTLTAEAAEGLEVFSPIIRNAMLEDGRISSGKFLSNLEEAGHTTHGPALTRYRYTSHPEKGTSDYVHCFLCSSWPTSAAEFLHRERTNGWPTKDQLEGISNGKCYVVPVGHPLSDEKDLEWRFSFSIAERKLMGLMDSTMHACIYLLKGIVKKQSSRLEQLNEEPRNLLSSYSLKTACLWTYENLPTNYTHTLPLELCHLVIDRLVTCYSNHHLPNYFIRQQNLIEHFSEEDCKRVVTWLNEIKNDFWRTAMCSIRPSPSIKQHLADMYEELGVLTKPKEDGEFKALESALRAENGATDSLKTATGKITRGSYWFRRWERYWMGIWSTYRESLVYEVLQTHAECQMSSGELLLIPEKVILPIMEQIDTKIKKDFVPMFQTAMHRHLGDLYHSLATYFTTLDQDKRSQCIDKAVQYYSLGKTTVCPDGWTDNGLVGTVLLTKLHYFTGASGPLAAEVGKLKRLLHDAEFTYDHLTDEHANGYSYILIHKYLAMSYQVWASDDVLVGLFDDWDDVDVRPHSFILACYFIWKEALRQHDLDTASWARKYAEKALLHVKCREQLLFSEKLVKYLADESNTAK